MSHMERFHRSYQLREKPIGGSARKLQEQDLRPSLHPCYTALNL